MDPRHIREYQAELFQYRKLSANSVGPHLAVLRFFYIKTLRRAWSLADTPYPKKTRHLPTILSREEVAQLLHAARNPGERILLMALYASGARNAELTHLKVSDIDSQRMVVHIRGGKGRKDCAVMLSPKLLVAQIQWEYLERPKVGITEEDIKKGERRSHVEGIWADTEDRYRLGIVPAPKASSADYVAVVLRSSTPLWQAGEIKAEIRSTASPDIFTCTYFMARECWRTSSRLLASPRHRERRVPFQLDLPES